MSLSKYKYETVEYHADQTVQSLRNMAADIESNAEELRKFADQVEQEIENGKATYQGSLFAYNVTELVTRVVSRGFSQYPLRNAIAEAQKAVDADG